MEQNEKKYWLTDIESGWPYQVSKEYYEQYMEMWEVFRPKITNTTGIILLTGTAGEMDNSWYEALKSYKDGK